METASNPCRKQSQRWGRLSAATTTCTCPNPKMTPHPVPFPASAASGTRVIGQRIALMVCLTKGKVLRQDRSVRLDLFLFDLDGRRDGSLW